MTPPVPPVPASKPDEAKSRYRATLNLPQTTFPMKANLVQHEPASVKRWQQIGVYQRLREERADAPRWTFHDGPPYANAPIHLGHLMNKCLKDIVVRSRTMQGYDVPYIPGWDCHGLPIEHKVMTDLMEGGKGAKLLTLDPWTRATAVRRECQKHAEKFVKLQAGQMQRLLTLGDYERPYMTMAPEYEAATLDVLARLLERGLVYRALKPVHWSIANETALAEAELEYQDREDTSVYLDFEAKDADAVYDAFGLVPAADDTEDEHDAGEERKPRVRAGVRPSQRPCFMIWTTTPWTLPANLAIALNPKYEYALVWIDGNVTVMAVDAVERVTRAAKSQDVVIIATTSGARLVGSRYAHPFVTEPQPGAGVFTLLAADYVTLEDGTGLVHTAPGHGTEDYQTGLRAGLPVYCPVRANGTYDDTAPDWLRGLLIWDANALVVKRLADSGHLFFHHTFTHSYPHDWRSKTPVIFRCTEQWFISVEKPFSVAAEPASSLRQRALDATRPDGVKFVPDWGRNRMRGMLESRPDWCISRQRAWGIPVPGFVLPDGSVFMTAASCRAVQAVVAEKGSDAWFNMTPEQLLAGYDPAADAEAPEGLKQRSLTVASLKKSGDILDVWFESGSSWNAVMNARGLGYPAELYLEGSDQHRGWFQSSLLTALGATGGPPYKALLTHGFMVDRDGKKLSKSRPDAARYEVDAVCAEFGIDAMRWWVSSLAYENDVKVDIELFALGGDAYRKVRNTLRFLLSNLADFTPGEGVEFPPTSLDAWVLGEFDNVAKAAIDAYNRYDYQGVNKGLFDFCNDTLSATYLAAVKDRLYCDRPDSPRRRRTQAALYTIADGLCRLLAPILCHTADEAYRSLLKAAPDDRRCVHLLQFLPSTGVQPHANWAAVHAAAMRARGAMEAAKSGVGVENPLDAGVVLPDPDGALGLFDAVDLADLLGVSRVSFDPAAKDPRVLDLRAEPRCDRSWKRDGTVRPRSDGGVLSDRDAAAVGV